MNGWFCAGGIYRNFTDPGARTSVLGKDWLHRLGASGRHGRRLAGVQRLAGLSRCFCPAATRLRHAVSADRKLLTRWVARVHDVHGDCRTVLSASAADRSRPVCASVGLNKEIAGKMDITETTVKVHRSDMMRTVRAASAAELCGMVERLKPFAGAAASRWARPIRRSLISSQRWGRSQHLHFQRRARTRADRPHRGGHQKIDNALALRRWARRWNNRRVWKQLALLLRSQL